MQKFYINDRSLIIYIIKAKSLLISPFSLKKNNKQYLFINVNFIATKNKEEQVTIAAYCTDFQLDVRRRISNF